MGEEAPARRTPVYVPESWGSGGFVHDAPLERASDEYDPGSVADGAVQHVEGEALEPAAAGELGSEPAGTETTTATLPSLESASSAASVLPAVQSSAIPGASAGAASGAAASPSAAAAAGSGWPAAFLAAAGAPAPGAPVFRRRAARAPAPGGHHPRAGGSSGGSELQRAPAASGFGGLGSSGASSGSGRAQGAQHHHAGAFIGSSHVDLYVVGTRLLEAGFTAKQVDAVIAAHRALLQSVDAREQEALRRISDASLSRLDFASASAALRLDVFRSVSKTKDDVFASHSSDIRSLRSSMEGQKQSFESEVAAIRSEQNLATTRVETEMKNMVKQAHADRLLMETKNSENLITVSREMERLKNELFRIAIGGMSGLAVLGLGVMRLLT